MPPKHKQVMAILIMIVARSVTTVTCLVHLLAQSAVLVLISCLIFELFSGYSEIAASMILPVIDPW